MEIITSGVTLKLFAGFLVTSELRMHLKASLAWKEAQIVPKEPHFQCVHFEGREYWGYYLSAPLLTLTELSSIEMSLCSALQEYCPQCKPDKLILHLFSQSFIH